MKILYLVGLGVGGSEGTAGMTLSARRVLEQAEVFFGAPRMIEMVKGLGKPAYPVFKPDAVIRVLRESHPNAMRVAALLSGDIGFYSGASGLVEAFERMGSGGIGYSKSGEDAGAWKGSRDREDLIGGEHSGGSEGGEDLGGWEVRLEPGVSSLSAFCARLRMPWQDVAVVSMHGTDQNVVDCVRRNRNTFCLCGNNAALVAERLSAAGFGDLSVDVGENLGLPKERVSRMPVEALSRAETASLTVLMIHNPEPDDRQRTGIPDEEFLRVEKIPMTKSEVRAVSLSRLRLSPGSVCYDVGAGTGSVTVEMALAVYRGRVYAVEPKVEALSLLSDNCKRFRIGNVIPILGFAPEALDSLPPPDAAFIGGSGGRLEAIVDLLLERNPDVRLVVTAVTVETASEALRLLESRGMADVEMTQVSVARARKVGSLHMLTAQNPVTILSAGGK